MKRELASGTPVWAQGEGPTVIFVHGVLVDHRMWREQVRGLAGRHRVVTYDTLSHGEAPDPPGPRSLDDYVRQAHEVVSAFSDAGPPVLAGFSMGGLIAQAYGIAHGGALRGLAILHAVYERNERERETVRERLRAMREGGVEAAVASADARWFDDRDRRERAGDIADLFGWMRERDFATKLRAYEVFATGDASTAGRLGAIDCPTLVLTGELDSGSTPAMSERIAGAIAGARLEILDGQRHMACMMDAERFNRILDEFLTSV